ncbi:uncharacterized protein THITE_2119378 [Thermothielavioides terrestris NRRL 8126]|uniref:Uncharacterized protein n=1 Tax=Thermothielavioides terrestris (strain ATCC 38088 / NRRL 8126) TaxID=578455 RepID=G2RBQ1_THETT|nr:uncharacterized protein THITE_2119378 [Thermothielavioides terrestris NRRL 8126]AEO69222.1 hypothetical protein THITE_2119378 [Thermothielavioides terrestris NRRL 8126]
MGIFRAASRVRRAEPMQAQAQAQAPKPRKPEQPRLPVSLPVCNLQSHLIAPAEGMDPGFSFLLSAGTGGPGRHCKPGSGSPSPRVAIPSALPTKAAGPSAPPGCRLQA